MRSRNLTATLCRAFVPPNTQHNIGVNSDTIVTQCCCIYWLLFFDQVIILMSYIVDSGGYEITANFVGFQPFKVSDVKKNT